MSLIVPEPDRDQRVRARGRRADPGDRRVVRMDADLEHDRVDLVQPGDRPLDPLAEDRMRRAVGDDRHPPAEAEAADEVRLHAGERALDGERPGRDRDGRAGLAVAVGAAQQRVDLSAQCHPPNPRSDDCARPRML